MYSDPDKLAKLLGIEKLPDFIKQEPFTFALDEIFSDAAKQEHVLGKVNQHIHPPATAEELRTIVELYKMGMHYVQHKTGKNVARELKLTDSIREGDGQLITDEFSFSPHFNSYILTFKHLAADIDGVRHKKVGFIPHAPNMGFSCAAMHVILGAEEAHHAVTYVGNPEFYRNDNPNNYPGVTAYFKRPLELEFGKFLPGMVSDFGFQVTPLSLHKTLDKIRGDIPTEEMHQLYRERIERKHGFKLPGNDEDLSR